MTFAPWITFLAEVGSIRTFDASFKMVHTFSALWELLQSSMFMLTGPYIQDFSGCFSSSYIQSIVYCRASYGCLVLVPQMIYNRCSLDIAYLHFEYNNHQISNAYLVQCGLLQQKYFRTTIICKCYTMGNCVLWRTLTVL